MQEKKKPENKTKQQERNLITDTLAKTQSANSCLTRHKFIS